MVQTVATKDLCELARLGRILKDFPIRHMNLRYEAEADVLYVKFADTEPVYQSELTEDDFLIEYDSNNNVVGVTIPEASKR